MTTLVCVLWLIPIVQLFSGSSAELYHIVLPNNTDSCQNYPKDTCFTLDEFQHQFKNGIILGDNTIVFMNGNHMLTWNMHFQGTGSVELLQNSEQNGTNSTPMITCLASFGVYVNITKDFSIQGLVFIGVEGVVHKGSILKVIKAAHTNLTKSSFLNVNSNTTVVTIFQTVLSISNCRFINNSANFSSVLEIWAKANCHIYKSEFRSNRGVKGGAIGSPPIRNDIIVLRILDSIFINNSASISGGAIYTQSPLFCMYSTFEANSCPFNGGAVYASVVGSNTSLITNVFLRNSAQQGAALYITGIEQLPSYLIFECTFTSNNAADKDYPSVLYMEKINVKLSGTKNVFERNFGSMLAINSDVEIVSSTLTFKNNTGTNGGAIALVHSNIKFGDTDDGLTTQVYLMENKASSGAGMYLEQSIVSLNNILLSIVDNIAKTAGGGIYAFESQISCNSAASNFDNLIYVLNNLADVGGGLYMTGSILQLSIAYFGIINNTANQYGGGAYLERDSRLIVNDAKIKHNKCQSLDVLLDFTGNLAVKGGGIFVANSINPRLTCDKIASPSKTEVITKRCFIQTATEKPIKIGVVFNNNSVTEVGNDIYGGLLDRCTVAEQFDQPEYYSNKTGLQYLQSTGGFSWAEKTSYLEVCVDILPHDIRVLYGNVTDKTEFHNHISSDPMRVCFCVNGTVDCDYTHPTIFTKKGEEFTLSLVAVDQVEKPVNATLFNSLLYEDQGEGRLSEGQQSIKLHEQCSELKYNVFSSTSHAALELYTEGPCGNKGISKQLINITFEPCVCSIGLERYPPYIDCACDCNKELMKDIKISNCCEVNGTIQLNQNIWITHLNSTNYTTQFILYNCPFDYCKKKPLNVSLINETETNKQCAFNRTGTLCGKCEQGLSMMFATSQCHFCSNYYLLLLLPFSLAGIALVVFILLFNMTVATGTIHGLIFYANILAANRSIFLSFTENFLTVFISWLNLDLGIETCFYNGMDSYTKFLLQIVFPIYVFLLIGIFMILCNRSERFSNLLGKRNPETTLYTLMFLSFSKLIQIIITALQFAVIEYPNTQKILWLFDGNVEYLTISHIPRFLAATLITILGTVYIVLLLCGQAFNRCSNWRIMKWTTHQYYIHFMNAHHAPFDNGHHRYWVGLLFLARLVHYFISTFLPDTIILLSLAILGLAIILYKLLNKNIYNSWWLDALESSFILNLTILATSTLYIRLMQGDQYVLANISMAVAFVEFAAIVVYHAIVNVCGVKCNLKCLYSKLLKFFKKDYVQLQEVVQEDDNDLLLEIDNRCNDESAGINPPPIIRLVADPN